VADHDDARWEHGFHPLRVKAIVQETGDTRSFVLDVPPELHDLFRYRPGQFCTFRVHIDGDEVQRCYSMSSAPETDDDLVVTVKRVPGGLVSNWFHDEVSEGDTLEVTKPAGVFCLRDHERSVVGFVGGSGVTPVMSLTKSTMASTARPVRLLYANSARPSVIFDEQLDALERQHADRLQVRHHLDDDGGFLTAPAIAEFASASLDADFYICGPGPFMDLVETTLLDLGVTADQILIERFVTADQPRPDAVETTTDVELPEQVAIMLKGITTTIAYQPGDTVLETARRGGLQPPFSCEAGNCATCMALLHEGQATMRANNALTPEEVDEGWILTCQALPQGPVVTVEYENL
jgi:3-ketosteroid 9alpha-monooxygenase subunit B